MRGVVTGSGETMKPSTHPDGRERASSALAWDQRSNSPCFIPCTNSDHACWLAASSGPGTSLESRTATVPAWLAQISTQFPASPLYDDLRHAPALISCHLPSFLVTCLHIFGF